MERELSDEKVLPPDTLQEMESNRIKMLNDAGIDELDVLEKANKHLNTWNSYFNENIVRGKDDLNFCIRDQWTAIERSEFSRLFKPAMTYNKLYDAVKKIAGEQRKNKPDLIVRSLTGKASQEQINLRADLVRTISYQSQNDLVYQVAFKNALMMGFGAFQVVLDYESPNSFNQVIRYDLIPDPTRCSWDPTALKPHKGDGNWCGRSFLFTREEFFATYPYVDDPVSFIDPYMLLDFQWQTRDTICVQDYFVKEWFPSFIYKLSDGSVVTQDELENLIKLYKEQEKIVEGSIVENVIKREMPRIVSERQTQDYKIMHYRMLKDRIIDFSLWPSKFLPIIFVDGDSYYIEGRQYTKSFIHEARDAQKFINYVGSEIAAEIKNRRREQWLGTPDNIIGNEQQWRNPELQMGALIAKPDPKTGQMPQKMPAWDLSPALITNFQRGTQDIREILGFSETEALQGRDISGKARRERKLEGSMSAYVFFDNLNQAIEQSGRVVNDLLPFIIGDDERHMVLSKKDGKTNSVVLNQQMKDGSVSNQIKGGDFDVELDTGPSFAVQRDIALDYFQQTVSMNPQIFNLIADLWAGNLDIQQMDLVKERLKTLVPPEILAKEAGQKPPPPQPNPQMMMMQQEMQNKQAQIQAKMEEIELKKQKLQLEEAELMLKAHEAQNKNQMDVYNHQADLERSRITHGLDHHKSELDFSHKIASLLSDLHKHEKQHAHEKEMNKHKNIT
jgi:hypothetical protein